MKLEKWGLVKWVHWSILLAKNKNKQKKERALKKILLTVAGKIVFGNFTLSKELIFGNSFVEWGGKRYGWRHDLTSLLLEVMLNFLPDLPSFRVGVEKMANHVHLEDGHADHGNYDDCAEKADAAAV